MTSTGVASSSCGPCGDAIRGRAWADGDDTSTRSVGSNAKVWCASELPAQVRRRSELFDDLSRALNERPYQAPRLFSMRSMAAIFQGVPIAFRRARAHGSAMHAAALSPRHRRRPTRSAPACLGAAAGAVPHRLGVAQMVGRHVRPSLVASNCGIGTDFRSSSILGRASVCFSKPGSTLPTMACAPAST